MKKIFFRLEGMHCVSCEHLLEKELGKIGGVKSCRISHQGGDAEVECDGNVTMARLEQAVRDCGYSVAPDGAAGKIRKRPEKPDYLQIVLIAIGLGIVLWVLGRLQVARFLPDFGGRIGVLAALPLGIAASLSTCLAVTGGIVMSFGAKVRIHEGSRGDLLTRAMPHLHFHAGRIAGFALLGGVLGLIGGRIEHSLSLTGYVTIAVALIMFYMGLNILGLVPSITRLGLHLPKSWALKVEKLTAFDHHLMPATIGVLTFFLPCGFTQAMQIAAAASGGFAVGAAIMGLFAVGTMPVLLGIGVGSTYAYKDRLKTVYRVIGVLVLYFALYSFSSGLALAGAATAPEPAAISGGDPSSAESDPSFQVVDMEVDWTFVPTEFEVQLGVPVVWRIDGKNLTGCSSEIVIPSLGIRKRLQPGPNIIEFTPERAGILSFSCGMGMIRGKFIVTE